MTVDEDFIEVEEVVTYIITCLKCRLRFRADSMDKAARMVAAHRKNAHDAG
jgi:hypothetical protein